MKAFANKKMNVFGFICNKGFNASKSPGGVEGIQRKAKNPSKGPAGESQIFPVRAFFRLRVKIWGRSSVGRASVLHAEGRQFDPVRLHHLNIPQWQIGNAPGC